MSAAGILFAGLAPFGKSLLSGDVSAIDYSEEESGTITASAVYDPITFDESNGAIARSTTGYYRVGNGTRINNTYSVVGLTPLRGTKSNNFYLESDIYVDVAGADLITLFGGMGGGMGRGNGGGFSGTFFGQGHTIYFYSSNTEWTAAAVGQAAVGNNLAQTKNGYNGLVFDMINGAKIYDLNIIIDTDIVALTALTDVSDRDNEKSTAVGILAGGAKGNPVLDNVHVTIRENRMFGAYHNGGTFAAGVIVGGMFGEYYAGSGQTLTFNNSSVTIGGMLIGRGRGTETPPTDSLYATETPYNNYVGGFVGGNHTNTQVGNIVMNNCKLGGNGNIISAGQSGMIKSAVGGLIGTVGQGFSSTGLILDFGGKILMTMNSNQAARAGLLIAQMVFNDTPIFENIYKTKETTPLIADLAGNSVMTENATLGAGVATVTGKRAFLARIWAAATAGSNQYRPYAANGALTYRPTSGDLRGHGANNGFGDGLVAGFGNKSINGVSTSTGDAAYTFDSYLRKTSTDNPTSSYGRLTVWPIYAKGASDVGGTGEQHLAGLTGDYAISVFTKSGSSNYYASFIEYPILNGNNWAKYAPGTQLADGGIVLGAPSKTQRSIFFVERTQYQLSAVKGYVMEKYTVNITSGQSADSLTYNGTSKYSFGLEFKNSGGTVYNSYQESYKIFMLNVWNGIEHLDTSNFKAYETTFFLSTTGTDFTMNARKTAESPTSAGNYSADIYLRTIAYITPHAANINTIKNYNGTPTSTTYSKLSPGQLGVLNIENRLQNVGAEVFSHVTEFFEYTSNTDYSSDLVISPTKTTQLKQADYVNPNADAGTSFNMTLNYGERTPRGLIFKGLDGKDIEVILTWSIAMGDMPTYSMTGQQKIIITPTDPNYETKSITIKLTVLKANMLLPKETVGGLIHNDTMTITYGSELPTLLGNFINANNTDLLVNGELDWKLTGDNAYLKVGSYEKEVVVTAIGETSKAQSYQQATLRIKIEVVPFVIENFSAAFVGKEYTYRTTYATIKKAIEASIKEKLPTGTPKLVLTEISDKIAIFVGVVEDRNYHYSFYEDNDMLDVLWENDIVGGTVLPYYGSAYFSSTNVIFKTTATDPDTRHAVPNFTANFKITRLTLRDNHVAVNGVRSTVYNGYAQAAEMDFSLNRGATIPELFTVDEKNITYYIGGFSQGNPLTEAPNQAGIYFITVRINSSNYITDAAGINVKYEIKKSDDILTYIYGLELNGEMPNLNGDGTGEIILPFSYSGNAPKVTAEPLRNEYHKFLIRDSVVGNKQIINEGTYPVVFTITSPNFNGTLTLNIDYIITKVAADDENGGIGTILDKIFVGGKATVEYTGKTLTADEAVKLAIGVYIEGYGLVFDAAVTAGGDIFELGNYPLTMSISSSNHVGDFNAGALSIEVVPRKVTISNQNISIKFDGNEKTPIPAVNTGIEGLTATLEIVSIHSLDLDEGVSAARVVGEYLFTYRLSPDPHLSSEEQHVYVSITKASQRDLADLVRAYVDFNNDEKHIYSEDSELTPAMISHIDAKYGITFEGIIIEDSKGETDLTSLKDKGNYIVYFLFASPNYDLTGDVYRYQLNYSVDSPTNVWLILAILASAAALILIGYFGFKLLKKLRPAGEGVLPTERPPTIYPDPRYKPDARPKQAKAVKEKAVKEPKAVKEKPVKEPKPEKEPKPIKEKPVKEPKPVKEAPVKAPKPVKEAPVKTVPKPAPQPPKATAPPPPSNPIDFLMNMKVASNSQLGEAKKTNIYHDR
jgi:hypothetical protein